MRGYLSFRINRGVICHLLVYLAALIAFVTVMVFTEEFPYALISAATAYFLVRVIVYFRCRTD